MTKRVTIYARVSTQDQYPETQVRDLKRFAKDRGLNVIKVYQEKASAAANRNTTRSQFEKLLDDVRKRRTDAVLVWKLDRLARSTIELFNRLEEFRTLGVEFLSYTENIDTATPADESSHSTSPEPRHLHLYRGYRSSLPGPKPARHS